MLCGLNAWGETPVYSLTFSVLTGTANSAYEKAHDTESNGVNWTVYGNQTLGDYLGVGGKSLSNVGRTLTSKSAVSTVAISKITLNHNGISNRSITINSIKVDIPDWVPLIGGKHIGFYLSEVTAPQIPTLAKGGVITSPTLAMVGEYAGADNNPEIVTPQHILKETIDASNGEVVSALYQMAQLVIAAINDVDMNVSIGDDVIAQSAKRGSDAYKNRTGKPLLA